MLPLGIERDDYRRYQQQQQQQYSEHLHVNEWNVYEWMCVYIHINSICNNGVCTYSTTLEAQAPLHYLHLHICSYIYMGVYDIYNM